MKNRVLFVAVVTLLALFVGVSCSNAGRSGSASFVFDVAALRSYRAGVAADDVLTEQQKEKTDAEETLSAYLAAKLEDREGHTIAQKNVPVAEEIDTVEIDFGGLEIGIFVKAAVSYYEENTLILSGESDYFEIMEWGENTATVELRTQDDATDENSENTQTGEKSETGENSEQEIPATPNPEEFSEDNADDGTIISLAQKGIIAELVTAKQQTTVDISYTVADGYEITGLYWNSFLPLSADSYTVSEHTITIDLTKLVAAKLFAEKNVFTMFVANNEKKIAYQSLAVPVVSLLDFVSGAPQGLQLTLNFANNASLAENYGYEIDYSDDITLEYGAQALSFEGDIETKDTGVTLTGTVSGVNYTTLQPGNYTITIPFTFKSEASSGTGTVVKTFAIKSSN